MIGLILPILVLAAVVLVVVAIISRATRQGAEKAGSDIVAYLIMALAMGVTGFALAELASVAFPGDRFVFEPAEEVATALSALVVATPFLVFLWRRQLRRRAIHPQSAGWTLYLTLIEIVFMVAFVINAVLFVNGVVSAERASAWTGAVVFGLILVFHEMAVRNNPPRSPAGELPRVVGSVVGFSTLWAGLVGVLGAGVFTWMYISLSDNPSTPQWHPFLAMTIVGAPVWVYRWLRPWDAEPDAPRVIWTVLVTIGSMVAAIGAGGLIVTLVLQYLLADASPAGQHFEPVPIALAVAMAGFGAWIVHRRALSGVRTNPVRAYHYAVSATGLVAAVGSFIALTIVTFQRDLIVGGDSDVVVGLATSLVIGLTVWLGFSRPGRRAEPETEAVSWPRRFFTLGLGLVFGLVAAGALIFTLFEIIRRLLDGSRGTSLLEPVSILIYTGLATWYLLAAFAQDRRYSEAPETVSPFDVTIVTSHPGSIATRFPKQARVRVLHRADGIGAIDDDTADRIVAAVDNRSSLVWVDEDGFRIAPKLET